MSLYSEYDSSVCGERGEWAKLKYADNVASWRSWRDAAILIGPVAVAHEGIKPAYDNRIEFATPSLLTCGRIQSKRGYFEGIKPVDGLVVDYPLIFDEELEAFAQMVDENETPVNHLWVDNTNARFIRAHRGTLPYVDLSGLRHDVPAENVTLTV